MLKAELTKSKALQVISKFIIFQIVFNIICRAQTRLSTVALPQPMETLPQPLSPSQSQGHLPPPKELLPQPQAHFSQQPTLSQGMLPPPHQPMSQGPPPSHQLPLFQGYQPRQSNCVRYQAPSAPHYYEPTDSQFFPRY